MQWKRITDPVLIPEILVSQIKDREFSIPDFYMTLGLSTGYAHKQFREDCYLYILIDEPGHICGFFWAELDQLTKIMWLHNVSILKKYWNQQIAIPLVTEKIKEIMKMRNATICRWQTTNSRATEALGFKPSQNVIHEYNALKETEAK